MAKRLIINADDFGYSPWVNEAVERAHSEGVLTSATLMANMPTAAEAVAIAKRHRRLGVGVHLNLFEAGPISGDRRVEVLADSEGKFRYSVRRLAFLAMFSHKVRTAIEIEMAAQIKYLFDSGLEPTHLDSHKHIHFFPAVYPIVCRLARRFRIGAVRYCREPEELSSVPWPLSATESKRAAKDLRWAAKYNRRYDGELFKTDMTLGLTHVGAIDTNFFKAVSLYTAVDTAEVMTHPAVSDEQPGPGRVLKMHRRGEFEALCDERTAGYLRDAGIELVNYGQL